MKKQMFVLALLVGMIGSTAFGQSKYYTKEGNIAFFSEAPIEKIEAYNSSATSVFDTESAALQFAVLIKAFEFEKALMQEHFNENYMESSKFPKSTFKGMVTNMAEINLSVDGEYKAMIKGDLTIHGVTKPVETSGTFKVKDGAISAKSVFEIAVADYGIEIPNLVRENIAKVVKITVDLDYKLLEKS